VAQALERTRGDEAAAAQLLDIGMEALRAIRESGMGGANRDSRPTGPGAKRSPAERSAARKK
jgi:hypothetical protein